MRAASRARDERRVFRRLSSGPARSGSCAAIRGGRRAREGEGGALPQGTPPTTRRHPEGDDARPKSLRSSSRRAVRMAQPHCALSRVRRRLSFRGVGCFARKAFDDFCRIARLPRDPRVCLSSRGGCPPSRGAAARGWRTLGHLAFAAAASRRATCLQLRAVSRGGQAAADPADYRGRDFLLTPTL